MFKPSKGVSTSIVILVIGLVGLSVAAGAYLFTRPEPDFKIHSFEVSSERIGRGRSVRVEIGVTNLGGAGGTHEVVLKVDDNVFARREVELGPGENTTLSFVVEGDELGVHTLTVENLTRSFTVVEPAEFHLLDLKVDPKVVEVGQPVEISVNVRNTGDLGGTHTLKVMVEGREVARENVSLDGGENRWMSFRVRENVSETYNVSVDGLKSSFTVYKGIVKKYEWEGPLGEDGNLSVKFSQNLYNYYRGLSHVAYETEDSLKFVTYRENVIQTIANKLGGVYADPEKETNYILSFVQKCFPYTLESEEYWRYPVETLVDNGDCEDKAFLFASVMKAAGHDVCLIVFDNHMMVGVVLPDPPTYATRGEVHWFESEGKKYYTCETTGEGWRVGDIPESYEGESAEILVVE